MLIKKWNKFSKIITIGITSIITIVPIVSCSSNSSKTISSDVFKIPNNTDVFNNDGFNDWWFTTLTDVGFNNAKKIRIDLKVISGQLKAIKNLADEKSSSKFFTKNDQFTYYKANLNSSLMYYDEVISYNGDSEVQAIAYID